MPTAIKRKLSVTTLPTTGRAVEEAKWNGAEFEPTGPAKDCSTPDRRGFDELGLAATQTRADETITVARKSYTCTVGTYEFRGEDGRITRLTLWRCAGVKLPPRTMSINNQEIPLPEDALQADFTVEGSTISTKGQRRIIALASLVRIGGRDCECVVESITSSGASTGKPVNITTREWSSADLPGEKLRTLTTMAVGQLRVDSDVSVVDFHVAAPGASQKTPDQ
jgi:hypothetical protein